MAKNYLDISLLDVIPPSIKTDEQVLSMCKAIDPELREVAFDISDALILSRIDELPEDVLDILAWQYHIDMYESDVLPVEQKRALVKNALLAHKYKGTRWAIRQTLEDLGFSQIKFREWWDLGTAPYTFSVEVYPFGETLMRKAQRCILEYKNVRSHLLGLIGRLVFEEDVTTRELLSIHHPNLLIEIYPWPEMTYGDTNTPLRYADPNDPGAQRYSIFEKAETFVNVIRHCFFEYAFAQHHYGTTDTDLLYGDPAAAAAEYGIEAVLVEELTARRTAGDVTPQEALDANETFRPTIRWIL